jgi:predicted RND superfamily exporter protein
MSKLTFANDYQIFFGEGNPDLQKWDEYQATFSNTDNVLFVLQFPEGISFARDMAMVIEDLTDRAGALGMKLAPVTIIAPNIIWALAIADCIHIIGSVQKTCGLVWIRQPPSTNLYAKTLPLFSSPLRRRQLAFSA